MFDIILGVVLVYALIVTVIHCRLPREFVPRFKYGENVKVISGFYKGKTAVVKGFYPDGSYFIEVYGTICNHCYVYEKELTRA